MERKRDDAAFATLLDDILLILDQPTAPPATASCDFCRYIAGDRPPPVPRTAPEHGTPTGPRLLPSEQSAPLQPPKGCRHLGPPEDVGPTPSFPGNCPWGPSLFPNLSALVLADENSWDSEREGT